MEEARSRNGGICIRKLTWKIDGGDLGRTNQEQKKRVDVDCGKRVGTGKVLKCLEMDCATMPGGSNLR